MPSTQEVRLPAVISERLLAIPDYQRPYAWRRKQLNDLWEDLDLLGPSGSHYAGTLVLREIAVNGQPKTSLADDGSELRHCEVVDGQQRLTTCMLLLDRIRRRLDTLSERGVENAAEMSTRIRRSYGLVSIDQAKVPRLRLGAGLNEYWVETCLGDQHYVGPHLIAGQERLRDAAAFFDDKLATFATGDDTLEFARLKDLQRRVTAGLGFLVYEVQSVAEVGVIFETLNERGRGLSELEKTKNYLLYLARSIKDARSDQLAELINHAWAEILRNLAREADDADDQLLRAHWLATQNPDRREWKRIESIKRRFDRSAYISGETRIVPIATNATDEEDAWNRLFADVTDYVTTLRECSFFLSEMFNPTADFGSFTEGAPKVRHRSAALFRSGVVALYRPLLFAARLKHPDDGELYARLVDMCERYSARVFVIRQRRANAGEARLLRLAYDLYGGEDPEYVISEVTALLWRYAPDLDVRDAMTSTRENWYSRRGHKYFLYEYELDLKAPGQELPPMSFFTDTAREQRTTEHILPQTPKADDQCWWDWFTQEQHAEMVHALGNLALTYDNSVYSNKCFRDKRGKPLAPGEHESKCYAQATLKQERMLAQYEDWTPETIRQRQAAMADWALTRWAVASPDVEQLEAEEIDIEPEGVEEDDTASPVAANVESNLAGRFTPLVGADSPTLDREWIRDQLRAGSTPDQIARYGGNPHSLWLAAIEEEARLNNEHGTFPARPEAAVTLRDERQLRWERIAVRIYGDPRRTSEVRRLYDEAKGTGASRRSYTGQGRRFPSMEA
jgi:hypothetical protein